MFKKFCYVLHRFLLIVKVPTAIDQVQFPQLNFNSLAWPRFLLLEWQETFPQKDWKIKHYLSDEERRQFQDTLRKTIFTWTTGAPQKIAQNVCCVSRLLQPQETLIFNYHVKNTLKKSKPLLILKISKKIKLALFEKMKTIFMMKRTSLATLYYRRYWVNYNAVLKTTERNSKKDVPFFNMRKSRQITNQCALSQARFQSFNAS